MPQESPHLWKIPPYICCLPVQRVAGQPVLGISSIVLALQFYKGLVAQPLLSRSTALQLTFRWGAEGNTLRQTLKPLVSDDTYFGLSLQFLYWQSLYQSQSCSRRKRNPLPRSRASSSPSMSTLHLGLGTHCSLRPPPIFPSQMILS
jgi:hypothetical protein